MKNQILVYFLIIVSICKIAKCNEDIKRTIGHGQYADVGQFPWYAVLLNDYLCGGLLISEDYILTAAHCLIDQNKTFVELGMIRITNRPGNTIEVQDYIIHPNYTTVPRNDIAIIKLPQSIQFNSVIQPIRLATKTIKNSMSAVATVAGYGATEDFSHSYLLKYTQVKILSDDECEATEVTYNSETNLCALGYENEFSGTCEGDSGSPLVVDYEGESVAVGIVSYRVQPCFSGSPNFHTRISSYISWIEDVTGLSF